MSPVSRRKKSCLTELELQSPDNRTFLKPIKASAYPQLRRNDYIPLESSPFEEVVATFDHQGAREFYKEALGKWRIRFLIPCLASINVYAFHVLVLVSLSAYYAFCVYREALFGKGAEDEVYDEFLAFGCRRHAWLMKLMWPVLPWFVIMAQHWTRSVLHHNKFLEMLAPTACASDDASSEVGSVEESDDDGEGQDLEGGEQDLIESSWKSSDGIRSLYTAIYGAYDRNTNPHPKYWAAPNKLQHFLRRRFKLVTAIPFMCLLLGQGVAWYRHEYLGALIWLGLPGTYAGWCALQVALLHIYFIAEVCSNEIERLRLRMEVQWEGGLDWREIAGMHHYLDISLTAVWRMASWPLFVGMCGVLMLAFVCLVGGLQSLTSTGQLCDDLQVNALIYFIALFLLSSMTLGTLLPMCKVTELCMCQSSDKTSLLLTASQHSHTPMSVTVRQEYNSFMLYIHNTIIGVELPGFGHVDYSLIFTKAMTLFSTIPILLTIVMGGGHDTSSDGADHNATLL